MRVLVLWRAYGKREVHPIIDLIPVIICGIAVAWDLRTREIPDALSVILLAGALIVAVVGDWDSWWRHALGGLVGLLAAALASQGDRFGGGDVKGRHAHGAAFAPPPPMKGKGRGRGADGTDDASPIKPKKQ